MAKNAKVTDHTVAPFIVAKMVDARMVEEHARFAIESATIGAEVQVKVESQFGVSVGLTPPDAEDQKMQITIEATIKLVRQDDESTVIADFQAKHIAGFKIERFIGAVAPGNVPIGAIQPYAHLIITAVTARARDTFGRMGIPGITIALPDLANLERAS